MSTRLRTVLISGVRHAADYLRILADDDRVHLVGLIEEVGAPDWIRADSRAVAEAAGLHYSEVDDAAALASSLSGVDLAVVCSEPVRHARLAEATLGAGVDVLVDKPVATTLGDADRVLAAAQSNGCMCAVMNRTLAPATQRLRSWVGAGHVGLPRHLDLEFFASGAHFSTSVERPELVVDPALSGGGEILNFLGYSVDLAYAATGLDVVEVHAFADALFLEPHRLNTVEDTAVISLLLERDVTVSITLGRVPYAPGGTATTSSARLLGSHGHAIVSDDEPAVTRFGAQGATTLADDAGQVAARAYLHDVVTSVLGRTSPQYDITDARRTAVVIDAVYRAVRTGDVVRIS